MIALVDCNSFFCSVEKVFHPGLEGKPVCVLSSNDGCIVALTPEAKALGLRRGDPFFKKKELIRRHQVRVFSSNLTLYAAMSKRVNHILQESVPRTDVYSIDESFLYLDGLEVHYDLEDYMRDVVRKVKLYTDIPVSVGIAPTKTLAKVGSKFAKLYKGYRSVCMIDTELKRRKALSLLSLSDVWGIGAQTLLKLTSQGIHSPLEFADRPEQWVRSQLPRSGWQTWQELNGIPCIDTSEVAQRKSICTSRSFGQEVSDFEDLRSSVSTFAASVANKLRGQSSLTSAITVFIATNRFSEVIPPYANSQTILLPVPTADTIELTQAATKALSTIYRPGLAYKKAGVILSKISDASPMQYDLFDEIPNRPARIELMKRMDELNKRFGFNKIHLASTGEGKQAWHIKSEFRSGNYLTDINELLTVQV